MTLVFPAEVRRKAWIVHLAIIASLGVYFLAARFVIASQGPPPDPADVADGPLPLLRVILTALAAIELVAALALPRLLVTPKSVGRVLPLQVREKRVESRGAAEACLTLSIIRWALIESVAIYGLVLAIMSQDLAEYLPFGLAALVGLVLTPFSSRRFEQVYHQLLEAQAQGHAPIG